MANWDLTSLANGLRIVTTPMPATQAASVNIFVGVGSRSEPARLNGITHFLEHMVFKGTEKRPDAILIAQEIEGAGGHTVRSDWGDDDAGDRGRRRHAERVHQ